MTKQLDTLFINELTVPCIIGVFENERKKKQKVTISIALSVDTQKAGTTDDINDTVSYYDITKDVVALVRKSHYYLLEKLAQAVADVCLKDTRISLVKVWIEKPKALQFANSS